MTDAPKNETVLKAIKFITEDSASTVKINKALLSFVEANHAAMCELLGIKDNGPLSDLLEDAMHCEFQAAYHKMIGHVLTNIKLRDGV